MRKIYSSRFLDFKRARDVRARAQGDREESFTSGVADESKAESVLSILSIFLVGYRFSFSLSFARARASDV